MQRFSIFRKGKHTAQSGTTHEFSDVLLREAVAAYDPALSEAPIVVGHPTTNMPAYGWVKSMSFNEETGEVDVETHQVEEQFAELVEKGRLKKRSASWYMPNNPNNPKPGTLYLKHVGFLGAVAPAIKGLKDVAFAEDGAETIEFADRWTFSTLASLFRNLREHFIDKVDMETADRLVPAYAISDLERAANAPEPTNPSAWPAFSEDDLMTPAEIAAMQAKLNTLETQNAALLLNQVPANFAEQQTTLATREAAVAAGEKTIARAALEVRVDKLVTAGKMLPAQKANAVDFAMGLAEGEATIDFTETDKSVKKITQREAYLRQLESMPKVVDFTEQSAPDGAVGSDKAPDPMAVADKARVIMAKAEKDGGRTLSFTEAVAQATAEFIAE